MAVCVLCRNKQEKKNNGKEQENERDRATGACNVSELKSEEKCFGKCEERKTDGL